MRPERHQQTSTWHLLEFQEVLEQLGVNPEQGLTDVEVEQRKDRFGLNQLSVDSGEPGAKGSLIVPWKRVMAPIVVFLLFASIVMILLGEIKSIVPIVMIVALNVFLVIAQVYRTEQAAAALKERAVLKKTASPMVRVRRDGRFRNIPGRELVPGDIILLETGNVVVADGRLLHSANLCIQEASLTGESRPVDKTSQVMEGEGILLGDRRNMVYMGTAVTYGCGTAVVVATGMCTELGRIIELNSES